MMKTTTSLRKVKNAPIIVRDKIFQHVFMTGLFSTCGFLSIPTAVANCNSSDGINYTCSGTVNSPVELDNAQLNVTADSSFESNITGDNALSMSVTDTLNFSQETGSEIVSDNYGVWAENIGGNTLTINQSEGALISGDKLGLLSENTGKGSTEILVDGVITSNDGTAIQAVNMGENLTITQSNENGSIKGQNGIYADNSGSGYTSISIAGEVEGEGTAIYSVSEGTDLTINQSETSVIKGGGDAIYAEHTGKGAVLIDVSGSIEGTSGDGIFATNSGTDLTIKQSDGSISAGNYGIWAQSVGSGDLSITQSESSVINSDDSGIYAENNGSSEVLTNTSVKVSVSGIVKGHAGSGIEVSNGSQAKDLTVEQLSGFVYGEIDGISVNNSGRGDTVITIAGDSVEGNSGSGIYAVHKGKDLIINHNAEKLSGGVDGIYALNEGTGKTVIAVAGDMAGSIYSSNTGYKGTEITVADNVTITGNTNTNYGIYADNEYRDLSITLDKNTTLSGTDFGIRTQNTGNKQTIIQNEGGYILANLYGIAADNYGNDDLVISTQGKVEAISGTGIYTSNWGRDTIIKTSDSITGGYNGIYALNNDGRDLSIVQLSGEIRGSNNGIEAINDGIGKTSISVNGDVEGTTDSGIYVINSGSDITINQLSGDIIANNYGIYAQNLGNAITIKQSSTSSIDSQDIGIYSENYGIGNTTISLDGMIRSRDNEGLYAINRNGSNLTITQSNGDASIISGTDSIYSINEGTGKTTILVAGHIESTFGNGIYAINDTSATDLIIAQNSGTIRSSENGIYAENNGTGQIRVSVSGAIDSGLTGAGIQTVSQDNSTVYINLNSGADIYSTSGVAILDHDGDATVTLSGNAKVAGEIRLGEGDDILIIKDMTDISSATILDGGNTADSSVTDILGTANEATNKLLFQNTTQNVNAENLLNWQIVNLNNSTVTLNDYHTLVTGHGTTSDGQQKGVSLNNHSILTGSDVLNIDGDVFIDKSSRIKLSEDGNILGDVVNKGNITFNEIEKVLSIDGDYVGDNGSFSFNTVLGDDSSLTNKVVITGDARGTTFVSVKNIGGLGDQTLNGIEIIEVNGQSDAEFVQSGRIIAGAYDYKVQRSEINSNNWVLFSNLATRSEIGGYIGNISSANNMFNLRLHDRLGETQYTDLITGEQKVTSMWLRHQYGYNKYNVANGDVTSKDSWSVTQLGGDIAQWSTNGLNRLHLGVMAGKGRSHNKSHSTVDGAKGEGTVDGYSYGIYATWYDNNRDKTGLYVDTWALWNDFNASVSGDSFSEKYQLKGLTASVESGYSLVTGELGNYDVWLEPKGQLIWSNVKGKELVEDNGTRVKTNSGNLQARLGLRVSLLSNERIQAKTNQSARLFMEANWLYNTKLYNVTVNDELTVGQDGAHYIGELKVGVEGNISKNHNLWFNLAGQRGDQSYKSASIMLGYKYSF